MFKKSKLRCLTAVALSAFLCVGSLLTVPATENPSGDDSHSVTDPVKGGDPADDGYFVFDGSEGILQAGGLLQGASNNDSDEEVLGTDAASYEDAIKKVGKAIDEWDRESTTIVVDLEAYAIPDANFKTFWHGAINRNPQGFFINSQCSYYTKKINGVDCVSRLVMYVVDGFDPDDLDVFYDKADEIMDGIDPSWTDLQKILYIHDYLVTHIQYERQQPYSKFDAYNALVEGECVCQGYSLAFEYLINRIDPDFNCDIVSSKGINHAWNVLTYGGKKYFVDCTWDDPTGCYQYFCRYVNFLKSKDAFAESSGPEGRHGQATDWVDSYGNNAYAFVTGDEFDDYFWEDMTCHIPMEGNKLYYYTAEWDGSDYENKVTVHSYDLVTGVATDSDEFGVLWDVWNGAGYYTSVYSSIGLIGDFILITLPDCVFFLDKTDLTKINDSIISHTEGYIYSALFEDGMMYYQLGTSPNVSESTVTNKKINLCYLDGVHTLDAYADYVAQPRYMTTLGYDLIKLAVLNSSGAKVGEEFVVVKHDTPGKCIPYIESPTSEYLSFISIYNIDGVTHYLPRECCDQRSDITTTELHENLVPCLAQSALADLAESYDSWDDVPLYRDGDGNVAYLKKDGGVGYPDMNGHGSGGSSSSLTGSSSDSGRTSSSSDSGRTSSSSDSSRPGSSSDSSRTSSSSDSSRPGSSSDSGKDGSSSDPRKDDSSSDSGKDKSSSDSEASSSSDKDMTDSSSSQKQLEEKKFAIGGSNYDLKWTKEKVYDGKKHVAKGMKENSKQVADLDFNITKDGKVLDPGTYKLKFKNNSDVLSNKTPEIKVTLGKGYSKDEKKVFGQMKFFYKISPAVAVAENFTVKKPVKVENGVIKGKLLYKLPGLAKPLTLNKKNYTITMVGNDKVLIKVNGNIEGEVTVPLSQLQ